MTDMQIRSIVRDELRKLLARSAASLPPATLGAPPPIGLAPALDAWVALGGGAQGLTAAEALVAGVAQPETWAALCAGLRWVLPGHGVAHLTRMLMDRAELGGIPGDTPKVLGIVLRQIAGKMIGGRRLTGHRLRTGVTRWRVEAVDLAELAAVVEATPPAP